MSIYRTLCVLVLIESESLFTNLNSVASSQSRCQHVTPIDQLFDLFAINWYKINLFLSDLLEPRGRVNFGPNGGPRKISNNQRVLSSETSSARQMVPISTNTFAFYTLSNKTFHKQPLSPIRPCFRKWKIYASICLNQKLASPLLGFSPSKNHQNWGTLSSLRRGGQQVCAVKGRDVPPLKCRFHRRQRVPIPNITP